MKSMEELNDKKTEDDTWQKIFDQLFPPWNRILESVTNLSTFSLFDKIGIEIDHTFQEAWFGDRERQVIGADVIMVSTTSDVVVVNVKTDVKYDDVDDFLKQMENFKERFREFKDKTVYVAVAAIKFDGSSDIYAKKNGVFVLRANSESVFKLDDLPENQRRKYWRDNENLRMESIKLFYSADFPKLLTGKLRV